MTRPSVKSPTAVGSTITLNRPWFIIGWQNDIELPHGFRLNVSAQWYSKGDYNNFRMTKPRLFTNVGLQRDFNLKRMGTLTFTSVAAIPSILTRRMLSSTDTGS